MEEPEDGNFLTLDRSWSRYLADGWRSDMKILCNGAVFKVHTTIVCAQSTFFTNALKKEHNFKEAQTNTVTLEDENPATVDAAIKFMYLQAYSNSGHGKEVEQRVTFEISIYAFADKYGIGKLREHCKKKIEELLDVDEFSPKLFLRAASAVDDNIPENDKIIRPALASIASRNIQALVGDPKFWHIAGAVSGFGGAVLENLVTSGQLAKASTGGRPFTCPGCKKDVSMTLRGGDRGPASSWITYCPGCGCAYKRKVWENSRKWDV